jgi:hypothetical protein
MLKPGSTETILITFDGDDLKMEIGAPPRNRPGPPGTPQPEQSNLIFTGTKIND